MYPRRREAFFIPTTITMIWAGNVSSLPHLDNVIAFRDAEKQLNALKHHDIGRGGYLD